MKRKIVIAIALLSSVSLWAQPIWSVDDCMRYAVKNSPSAKKQELLNDDAKKNLTEATLSFLPTIGASTGVSASFGRSINPETNNYINTSYLGNSFGVSASISIFDGLRTLNGYRIAKVSKLREELATQQVDNQIATQTMATYYKAIFCYGALSIGREELKDSQKNYEKKKTEYEIGLANISDLSQLESKVSQSEYNVIYLEGTYKKSLIELKNEMYYPLKENLPIDTLGNAPAGIMGAKENTNTIIVSAMDVLPDYKISVANLKVAKYNVSTSKAMLFPSIGASGGISTGYSTVLEGIDTGQPGYATQLRDKMGQSVGISLSLPIFGGLSRQKNIQRQRNAYKRARIDSEQKLRDIERLVIEAVIDLESYEKQCNQSIQNVKSNNISYKTTKMKFNEGLSSVIDLQTTQTNLSRAKVDQLNAFLNYLMQRRIVDFYKGEPLIR